MIIVVSMRVEIEDLPLGPERDAAILKAMKERIEAEGLDAFDDYDVEDD